MTTEQPLPAGDFGSTVGLGVSPCTKWYRHDRANGWEFNHLEDGHAVSDKPTPKFASQAGWARATWIKYHCWLTADVPPKVVCVGADEQDA
jgi:hypothetical protein